MTDEERIQVLEFLLLEMVKQHCNDRLSERLFSGFISINAEAMVYLGSRGLLKITNDNSGRVVEAEIPTYLALQS